MPPYLIPAWILLGWTLNAGPHRLGRKTEERSMSNDHKRDQWPVDEQGFNALDPLSAEELGECYACIVGVWTGPESHSRGCGSANDLPPKW